MVSSAPFTLYESSLGQLLRGLLPAEIDPAVGAVPIIFQAQMPDQLLQRFRQTPVLNNDIQFKLAAAIRDIARTRLLPLITPATRNDTYLRGQVSNVFRLETEGLEKFVNKAMVEAVALKEYWRAYRVDSKREFGRVGITIAFVAIGAAIAPPTSGASIGLAIVSLVRGLTDATKKFSESYRTAEESRARVLAEIERLRAIYEKSSALGRASQIGGAAAHALTVGKMAAAFNSDPFPGFTRIKTELNAYKGKVGHLRSLCEMLGRHLYELLDQIDRYQRANNIDPARSDQLPPRLRALRDEVTGLLADGVHFQWHPTKKVSISSGWERNRFIRGKATISGTWERCQFEMAKLEDVDAKFKALKAMEGREKSVMVVDRILTLLLNLGVALASYNAPLSLHDHSATSIQDALRFRHDGHAWGKGGAAFGLGLVRQLMSLFKDGHALIKEVGLKKAKTDPAVALLEEVQSEFRRLRVPDLPPRLPNLSFGAALDLDFEDEAQWIPR